MTNYVTASIPLDDFMISFLCGAFPSPRGVPYFSFPRSHDLEKMLQFLVKGFDTPVNTEGFQVQFCLPLWAHESPYYGFTQKAVAIIKSRIQSYYQMVAHDFLSERRNEGYEIKECIYIFLQKYGIPDTDKNHERVKKDFDRWRNRQAVKKYKKNNKKKKQNCPVGS